MPQHAHEGQRTSCGNEFFLFTMWALAWWPSPTPTEPSHHPHSLLLYVASLNDFLSQVS